MEPKDTKVVRWEGVGVGPHSWAGRIYLHNISDRVYRIVHLFLYYERSAVATEPGLVRMLFNLTSPTGGDRWIASLRYTGNVLHDRGSYTLPNPITLWKNDRIWVSTEDASTGGAVDYRIVLVYEVI